MEVRKQLISEIMSDQVTYVGPQATVAEAARLMRDKDFGALPIADDDRLVGMLTDRDISIRVVADGKDPTTTTVREAMTPEVRYCFDDQTVEEIARNMGAQKVRRLPVMNRDKRLVGIVALGDLSKVASPQTTAESLSEISR